MTEEHTPRLSYGPFFREEEFACSCCGQCPPYSPDYQNFLSNLHILRMVIDEPFVINSGFRCKRHPEEAKKAGGPGAHFFPGAVDISVKRGDIAAVLVREALARGWKGIGVSQSGPRPSRYIHLDMKDRKVLLGTVMWSY